MSLDRALDLYRDLIRARAELGAELGAELSGIINGLAQDITRIVGAETSPTGVAVDDVERIVAETEAAFQRALGEHRNMLARAGASMMDVERQGLRAVYGEFGRSSVGRLRAARDAFAPHQRSIFQEGFREWGRRFAAETAEPLRASIRKALHDAQLMGLDQRGLAARIVQDPLFSFKNLPPVTERGKAIFTMGGKLGEADALKRRANVIARTETTAIQNSVHTKWTQEAGFEKYVSVNPLDDRTSAVCAAAATRGPLTLDEWQRAEGVPPRHPNCRSSLMAVPDGVGQTTGVPDGVTVDVTVPEGRKTARVTISEEE